MRYIEVIRFTMKPGHEGDFTKIANIYRDASAKAGIDNHFAVYQVVSGLPGGTFRVFLPLRSLAAFDRSGPEGDALVKAAGPDKMKEMGKLVTDGYATSQSQVFALNPKMSYVGKDMKAADPFWR